MGTEKARLEESEAAWDDKAQAEDIKCKFCSMRIPYGDRDVYYRTGMCGYCAHQAQKDD